MRTTQSKTKPVTLAEVLKRLGNISPTRIRYNPPPLGTATEQDLLDIRRHERRLFELVDGALVEKIMGYPESLLAGHILKLISNFVDEHNLGHVAGADGMVRLLQDQVRLPDVSFASWEHFPDHMYPTEAIPDLAPDLAVEVLSEGNTRGEIARKVREYFFSGTRLVWIVDPKKRHIRVYTAPDKSKLLKEGQSLDGGDVLPGLKLPLREVFARVPHTSARRSSSRGKKKPDA